MPRATVLKGVPTRDCHVATLLANHTQERTMINETANVGRGHVPNDRVSGRQYRRTDLYSVGSSYTRRGHVPALQGRLWITTTLLRI